MKLRIKYLAARLIRSVVPSEPLHMLLKILPRPPFGFMVVMFDPNNIRKKVKYSPPVKVLDVNGDGWNLSIDINDHIGYRTYLNNTPFEMSIFNLGQKLNLSEGEIVLDIGANIGTASVPICSLKNAELIAVEASKANAMLLAKNVLRNQLKAQLHLLALIDNDSSGYIKFYVQKGNKGANSIFKSWNPGIEDERKIEFVPTMTLDRLCESIRLDFEKLRIVKIDVEGAEEAVLRGGKKFLNQNVAPIVLEYRKDATEKYLNDEMTGLLNILTQNNYRLFSLQGENSELGVFDCNTSYENIIAIKTGSPAEALLLNRDKV